MEAERKASSSWGWQKLNTMQSCSLYTRDHMKDLRRYLMVKYIQYLVLPSSNLTVSLLGALGSLYAAVILSSPHISRKSTTMFISHIVKADGMCLLRFLLELLRHAGCMWGGSFVTGLLHNFQTLNIHVSCLLLSFISLEAFLITLFPAESQHIRTVKHAKLTCKLVWLAVLIECLIFQAEFLRDSILSSGWNLELLQYCLRAASLLRAFAYSLGLFLRILNVWFYYKIFFNRAEGRSLSRKKHHAS
ncbi:C-X-C chemokine receptor type 4-B-like [Latimeria chalumnae]|uniref:G-protein coupled receptors family 1 profile domain-containing protein n=1 Tax=Latimeria chalumnae TaxID=7897 RepID=H3B1E8_LATCH|nr:PREDICTED: C-X-C chemokine receptor type 4-B-like [Latimeria chalumnae]|eukprot:XP_006002265.1 PREDICTED: C-X-C chemokine receptor type 4-B-like [Latimeria chalumnae]